MSSSPQSILIIGATGGTGLECLRTLANHSSKPQVHAFCRDPTKLIDQDLCKSVIQGDATKSLDLEQALRSSHADWVVVCVGNGDSVTKKTNLRTMSAKALARVLLYPEFTHVRALVVSSTGVANAKFVVGLGVGQVLSAYLHNLIRDHSGQEAALRSDPSLEERTTIVRPTKLTTNHPTHIVCEFDSGIRYPAMKTDRSDLGKWIAAEIVEPKSARVVNITSVKSVKRQ